MMLAKQTSVSETTCEFFFLGFFSIRPTDPISGNAFDTKRKKRGDGLTLIKKLFFPRYILLRRCFCE